MAIYIGLSRQFTCPQAVNHSGIVLGPVSINYMYVDRSQRDNHYTTPPFTLYCFHWYGRI